MTRTYGEFPAGLVDFLEAPSSLSDFDVALADQSKSFRDWFEVRYGKEHHALCEVIGLGRCNCIGHALRDFVEEQVVRLLSKKPLGQFRSVDDVVGTIWTCGAGMRQRHYFEMLDIAKALPNIQEHVRLGIPA